MSCLNPLHVFFLMRATLPLLTFSPSSLADPLLKIPRVDCSTCKGVLPSLPEPFIRVASRVLRNIPSILRCTHHMGIKNIYVWKIHMPQMHRSPNLLFPLVSMLHGCVCRHLEHSWCTCSDSLVRGGSKTASNNKILFRSFSTWRFLTNVTEVPGDWEWSEEKLGTGAPPILSIHRLCQAHITSAMIKTNRQERRRWRQQETQRECWQARRRGWSDRQGVSQTGRYPPTCWFIQ